MSKLIKRVGTTALKYQFIIVLNTLHVSKKIKGTMCVIWVRGARKATSPRIIGEDGHFQWASESQDQPHMQMSATLYKKDNKFVKKKSTMVVKEVRGEQTFTVGEITLDLATCASDEAMSKSLELTLQKTKNFTAKLKFRILSRQVTRAIGSTDDGKEMSMMSRTAQTQMTRTGMRDESYFDLDSAVDYGFISDDSNPPSRTPSDNAKNNAKTDKMSNRLSFDEDDIFDFGGGRPESPRNTPFMSYANCSDSDSDSDREKDPEEELDQFSVPPTSTVLFSSNSLGGSRSDSAAIKKLKAQIIDLMKKLKKAEEEKCTDGFHAIKLNTEIDKVKTQYERDMGKLEEKLKNAQIDVEAIKRENTELQKNLDEIQPGYEKEKQQNKNLTRLLECVESEKKALGVECKQLQERWAKITKIKEEEEALSTRKRSKKSKKKEIWAEKIKFYEEQLTTADSIMTESKMAWNNSSRILMQEIQTLEMNLDKTTKLLNEALSGNKIQSQSVLEKKLNRAIKDRWKISQELTDSQNKFRQASSELELTKKRITQLMEDSRNKQSNPPSESQTEQESKVTFGNSQKELDPRASSGNPF